MKRVINSGNKWSLLFIDIDNLKPYTEIYGNLASDKILKAYTAIMKSAISKDDFLGQMNENDFLILTTPDKSEQIAAFLNYAFESISPKFYTNEDVRRGYLVLSGDEKIGKRIPLVSTSIGIISNQHREFKTYQEANFGYEYS